MSDHNVVILQLENFTELDEKIEPTEQFHKFPWHNNLFTDKYAEDVSNLLQSFGFSIDESSTYGVKIRKS